LSIKISFLDLNIIKREIEMKIQAKDLKVGDVISWKIISEATITEIEEFTQKNGKPCLLIKIRYGNQNQINHKFNMKPETKVTLK
jgi:hypothetical protein